MANSGTIWMPNPGGELGKVWLLDDGRIIEGPELEISGSGRKVRVKGRQETSVFLRDKDTIISQAVDAAAEAHGVDILTCLSRKRAISNEESPLPEVSLTIGDGTNGIGNLLCVWRFRHETLPLSAKVRITLQRRYGNKYIVNSHLEFDEVSPNSRHHPRRGSLEDTWDVQMPNGHYWGTEAESVRTQLAESGLEEHFQSYTCNSEREAIRHLRDQIEVFDEWTHVEIPDLRDFHNVKWITLKFQDSNIDGDLLSDITDFIDSEPLVEKVAEKYQELRAMLRHLGIVVDNLSADDFQRALSLDPDSLLQVRLRAVDDEDNSAGHAVSLHLHTGTLSVTCPRSQQQLDPDQASDKWKLARFEAEMQGELDAFLNYHAAGGDSLEDARHEVINIVRRRQD